MADNELDLLQWQIATQTLFATKVTPTRKLMGIEEGDLQPVVETSAVPEQRASLAPAFSATVDKVSGEGSLKGALNAEEAGYYLDNLFGQATPSGVGPYTRAYVAPLGTKPTPRLLTLLRGNALDARSLVGGLLNDLSISAETNKRVTFDGKLIGHSVVSDTVQALADNSVNYFHSNSAVLKFDTWAGTMGATALSPIAYKYELGLNFNKMLQMGLGALTPVGHKIKKGEPDSNQLKLSMELDATSAGYFNSIITATSDPYRAQIQCAFTIGTSVLTIKYAGYAAEAPKYVEDTDGVATLDFTFSPLYHSTFGNWLKIDLVNSVASL